ncbi:protein kinase-like domain, Phloem protein 2-like protein [Artemisia annua]|uniref:non-specific serine/threonine protein kinase n=1 Tax=Artemisia annua TaxID=35608 RepID=A0A2U1MWE4_ARTAN|nr:protein kinase-like domain, Phloem protein 2-like protein [Artemisia annua]
MSQVENLEHMRIRLSDIEFATEKFSDIYEIGSGGFGRVYRAELDLGNKNSSSIEGDNKGELPRKRNTVAIKRIFSRGDSQGEQGFFREVEMLSSCKHPNIVSLLGYCDEGGEMILVYEHASNKSLDEYLGNIDNPINLTWAQRIKICIGIAHGLNYLHSCSDDKQRIIHRDIKSDNILLGDKWEAKIADFGLSKLYNANKTSSTIHTGTIAGTEMYLDPEYKKTGKLKKESDIYSLGVVLFEILCGRLAYDKIYYADNEKGLASIVHRRYKDGTIKDMIDPKIKEEAHENIIMQNRGLIEDSLSTFLEIAYQCLEETQVKRPKMEVIIMELEKALYFQENRKDDLQISIQNIHLATENFSDGNCIGRGRYWTAYKGELTHAKGNTTIVAKRWDRKCSQRDHQFLRELDILYKCKHENIISLVGYCKEMDEDIIVYEHAFKGSLDTYLRDASLTWVKRLKICMDVAVGLDALHKEHVVTRGPVFHRDIKSTSILIDSDWNAKISNLELSATDTLNQEMEHILHGALIWNEDIDGFVGYPQSLVLAAKMYYDEGKFDEIVFEGIAEQIVPQSLQTFATIAIQCLHDDSNERPTANQVLVQLKKALEFQVSKLYQYSHEPKRSDLVAGAPSWWFEKMLFRVCSVVLKIPFLTSGQVEDYDIWEPKVPKDYKELLLMSQTPEKHTIERKKDLYDLFLKGIILQNGKVYFSIGRNGERNEMISSRSFLDKNSSSICQWRSISESRFSIVAEINMSELKIHIKIKTQNLSPGVNYRVHLIFRFSGPKRSLAKRMYVNLKYKMGNQNMSSYIASWRDDDWMMIGLYQFLNKKEDTEFEVLLESFSQSYCGNRTIYVEGIEFQAIEKVKQEEIEQLEEIQQILQSSLKRDKSWLRMVNEQTHLMLSEVQKKKDHTLSEVRRKKDRVRRRVNKKIDHALGEMSLKECQILGEAATKIDHLGGVVITRKDQLLTKVSKNYLITEVKKQKDHLLGKVNKTKDGMVTKMNRMKDHLKEVLYENINEENSGSENSAQSRFEADNAEILQPSDNNDCEELSSLSIVNRKKHHMLSANEALIIYNLSDVKVSYLKPAADSRYQEVIELLSKQVFRIKCKIESKMLSPNTEYVCYLVFKLSEKCQGFHCPVIIRDLNCWKNKEIGIVYFRSPSPWNLHDADHIPENRADGWIEVIVWKFNLNHDLRDDYIHLNLKFIVYEGTMSGLIVME